MSVEALASNFSLLPTASSLLSAPIFLSFAAFLSLFTIFLYPGGLAWSLSAVKNNRSGNGKSASAIPGPTGLPLVGLGHVFASEKTHRILSNIATSLKATPLMAFSVGLTRFVIASEPETAKEILNSSEFADRPIKESAYELLFNRSMGFAPFGDYWRNLRRISATHLFSPRRIYNFGGFRQEIGNKMVSQINTLMGEEGKVEIKNVLHFGSLNNVMMSVFGKSYDFFGKRTEEADNLDELVKEGYELLGIFNWGDHFAPLRWLDLQRVRRRCKNLVGKVNKYVANVIEEHRALRSEKVDDDSKDFVDVLLDLGDAENKLSDSDMIALLWEMIFRGTDTVAILLEWTLARMVVHPDIQAKAQAEIDSVVGVNRQVADSDLPNLPYLQAILKETLRVHPPGPLLSWARLSIHDTHVGPHFVPAGTTAMVNMYAITHDEKIWSNPNEFKPERFMEEDVPIMGSDLRLAPFGAGRRVCPGKAMGMATAQLWLAQMLQNFRWVPTENGVDLTECLNLSMEMKSSLVCKAVPRISA
ncbi:cytochrome P450 78A5-like [Chenopodium quinoa]|uniref:cytochrome P450 78A5-like n=1 Tax=Chenopodium quinoa TaxID=63459 RepID=UPI000B794C75|nr:cytochrome P450 78A5-like [Chenopodium quinoa]